MKSALRTAKKYPKERTCPYKKLAVTIQDRFDIPEILRTQEPCLHILKYWRLAEIYMDLVSVGSKSINHYHVGGTLKPSNIKLNILT